MFILASGSPRRKELLQQINTRFEIRISTAEELTGDDLAPAELVEKNAAAKASAVAKLHPNHAVLGADTVVALDGHTYGKPSSREDAVRMLKEFSGRTHQVLTGIAWAYNGHLFTDVVITEVEFAQLADTEIERYVKSGEPMDKAGAYAIQGAAAEFIVGIKGSFTNVVGLPLNATVRLARKAGVNLYGDYGEGSAP
ncbi:septum formation protein [Selenomonas ruminantium]|uniref:dTTP/UTP pyrophosphatase n=1 Tax=Selenomonas ruminantium TaxID=971 RepID=A0A1M6T2E4_SELRU|nr:Maf family protein [Selenomonas ruminantium]SHK51100.1 septum formation protein [Selenomonas ruminantium]